MPSSITLVFLSCVIAIVSVDAYTNRYDNFDIDSVLKSDRMYKSYLNCFLDLGPCNPMAEEGKSKYIVIINYQTDYVYFPFTISIW